MVGVSNAEAMALMVDHLVAAGARRVAFVGGGVSHDTRGADRRRGFVRAMERRGLDPTALVPIGGISWVANGAEAMARLPDGGHPPDAVACVADPAAFGALTECQRRGARGPDDVMVAGFGALEAAAHAVPSITTVDPHASEIGGRAGDLIAGLLAGAGGPSRPVRIGIRPELRPGGSTGTGGRA